MSITRTITDSKKTTGELGLEVGGEVSVSKFLTMLFPFLDAKVSAKATGGASLERTEEAGASIELRRIHTPQRQLVQLALHYIIDLPHRTRFITPAAKTDLTWTTQAFVDLPPRPLLFLELDAGTTLIPTASEVSTGEVLLLFQQLLRPSGERPPDYPVRKSAKTPEELLSARKEYWKWFGKEYSSRQAMEVIETATKVGTRIRWIDYRLPIGEDGTTLHIHVQGREQYDTGVFAYNMVKRTEEDGLRIVGTLKSGPDLNVLAVFER